MLILLSLVSIPCRNTGMYFTCRACHNTDVKYMDEVEFPELGDDVTLVASVDGHNIMPHGWGDKVRKYFISTRSTTLPGSLPIKVAGEKC